MKSRNEVIVDTIVKDGSFKAKNSALSFLRSESAKAEAELIHLSQLAQEDAIASIEAIKAKDLEAYKTQKTLDKVRDVFGKMLGNCNIVARRMVVANVISGKLRPLLNASLQSDELLKRLALTKDDAGRIDKMVNDILDRINRGVAFAMSSISRTLQNTALRVNATRPAVIPSKTKEKPKTDEKAPEVKQEPISGEQLGEQVKKKRAQTSYAEHALTTDELATISKDPIAYAVDIAKRNVDFVVKLRDEYISGRNTPLNSEEERKRAKLEAVGGVSQKAIFELGKDLRENGLFAFVDKGGKRWTLMNYCAMATRTTSTQSSNVGDLFADPEHDLYYIVPHQGACPICAKYQGRVYSRSGKDKRYPPLSSVFNKIDPNGTDDLDNTYLTIHPNCRHKIIKYVEQAQTKQQQRKIATASRKPFVLTKAQQKKQEEEQAYQAKRNKVMAERESAMREFMMYLQVLPPKDVCGNFIKFYEHKQQNDKVYKEVKRKYKEAIESKK